MMKFPIKCSKHFQTTNQTLIRPINENPKAPRPTHPVHAAPEAAENPRRADGRFTTEVSRISLGWVENSIFSTSVQGGSPVRER